MRLRWILVGLLLLSACKSGSSAPAEEEIPAGTETAAPAVETTPPEQQPPAAEAPPAEPGTPAPGAEPAPTVAPDPGAPPDVASPPKDAKRTKSGLASKVLKKGSGKGHPGKFDTVTLSYTGWTTDGRMFDSSQSYPQPMKVPLHHLLHGFAEGVQMMVAGEKRRLWIPGNLAYGEEGEGEPASPTQPLGMLVFDVELIGFERAPALPPAPEDVGQIPADAIKSESGLAWRVLSEGVGTDHPVDTSVVEMKHTVWTADGQVVDSSMLRGGPDTVGISRLVPGWTEGMKLMVEGERRLYWIPEELAYQGQPHRPAGMLVIDVTLVQIRRDVHQVR